MMETRKGYLRSRFEIWAALLLVRGNFVRLVWWLKAGGAKKVDAVCRIKDRPHEMVREIQALGFHTFETLLRLDHL